MNFEEMVNTGAVSLGGVVVGLSIIVWYTVKWMQESGKDKNWKALFIPFLPLMIYGMLLILSTGGILGGAAGIALWGSNEIGRVALEYGVGGTSPDVTRTTSLVLENGGHAVVILMTVAFAAYLAFSKNSRSATKGEGWIRKIVLIVRYNLNLIMPVISGVCLGLSDGLAGITAEWLGPAVDTLGGYVMGIF